MTSGYMVRFQIWTWVSMIICARIDKAWIKRLLITSFSQEVGWNQRAELIHLSDLNRNFVGRIDSDSLFTIIPEL